MFRQIPTRGFADKLLIEQGGFLPKNSLAPFKGNFNKLKRVITWPFQDLRRFTLTIGWPWFLLLILMRLILGPFYTWPALPWIFFVASATFLTPLSLITFIHEVQDWGQRKKKRKILPPPKKPEGP